MSTTFGPWRESGRHRGLLRRFRADSDAERAEKFRIWAVETHKRATDEHRDVNDDIFLEGIAQPHELLAAIVPNRDLIITGGVGRGKTYIARALAVEYEMSGKPVTWVRAVDWASTFRDEDAMNELVYSPVLAIDDFGVDAITPKVAARLFDIFDRRCDSLGKTNILTTNLSPDELRETLGDRILDRIAGPIVVLPSGPSRRQQPVERAEGELDDDDAVLRELWAIADGDPERRAAWICALYDAGVYEALRAPRAWAQQEHERTFVAIARELLVGADAIIAAASAA